MTEIQHPQGKTLACTYGGSTHTESCYTGSAAVDDLVAKVKQCAQEGGSTLDTLEYGQSQANDLYWNALSEVSKLKEQVAKLEKDAQEFEAARKLYREQAKAEKALVDERQRQEAAAKAKEAREAAAYERLKKQLEGKTTQEIAALLVERGVERVEEDPISPLEVLRQSGSIIEATYWIAGAEFQGDFNDDSEDLLLNRLNEAGVDKRIVVPVEYGYRAVTGVCSIGALALARTMMAKDNPNDKVKYLEQYGVMAGFDPSTRLSGFALSNAIVVEEGKYYGGSEDSNIAAWNDGLTKRTSRDEARALVLKVFRAAEKSPMLYANEAWKIEGLPYYFTSEQEAKVALIDPQHEVRPGLVSYYGGNLNLAARAYKVWERPDENVPQTVTTVSF